MKRLFLTLTFLAVSIFLFAQDSTVVQNEEATGMRANEKIYVVVAVLVTILAGLFIFIIRLDKKIGRLEKDAK